MGTAYIGRVVAKSGARMTVHVFQKHPDYVLDPEALLGNFGGSTLVGWAFDAAPDRGFSTRGWGAPRLREPGFPSEFAAETGITFDELFSLDAEGLAEHVRVRSTKMIRPEYNDDNRDARLVEAGYAAGEMLTRDVVMKICGVLELELELTRPEWLATTPVDTEWEY